MDIGIVSMRYAKALIEYAKDTGTEKTLYAEISSLEHSFRKHPDLRSALENPMLSLEEKLSLMDQLILKNNEKLTLDAINPDINTPSKEVVSKDLISSIYLGSQKNKINSQSICEDKEFAGLICKDNSGRYFSTAPNRGERKGSYPFNSPCPNGTEKVSAYHTHGADSHGEYWDEIFSGKDEKIVKSKDNNIKSFYLGTPSGNFKAIDNHGKEITNRKGLPNVCRVHGNM